MMLSSQYNKILLNWSVADEYEITDQKNNTTVAIMIGLTAQGVCTISLEVNCYEPFACMMNAFSDQQWLS